jgi:hypothetical protein
VFTLLNDSIVPMENTVNFAKSTGTNVVKYYFNNTHHPVCDGPEHVKVDHLRGEALANIFAWSFITRQN